MILIAAAERLADWIDSDRWAITPSNQLGAAGPIACAHFKRRSTAVPTSGWRGADSWSAGETGLFDARKPGLAKVLSRAPARVYGFSLAQLSGISILKQIPP